MGNLTASLSYARMSAIAVLAASTGMPVWASDLPAVTDLSPQALAALANPKPMQPKAELKKEIAKAAPAAAQQATQATTKTATAKPAPAQKKTLARLPRRGFQSE